MKFPCLRLALALVACLGLFAGTVHAQFKKLYRPDSLVLQSPSTFTAAKLIATDIPGKEISVIGTITTMDSGGVSRAEMFNLLCNLQGEPQDLHLFEDTSQFVFQPPKAYAGCYDGGGIFYFAVGASNQQVVFKTDAAGQMLWSRKGNHHEYYSMLCEGGSVTVLGQDESIQGAHDYSIASFDALGGGGNGMMYGTQEFEVPQKVAKFDGQYLLAGSTFQAGGFDGLLVKADASFNQIWGKRFEIPGKSLFITGIDEPLDGNGYILSGRARGNGDSLLLMKVDDDGNAVWTRLYGIGNSSEYYASSMVLDPATGGYLIGGYYRGPQYFRPIIVKTDSVGAVLWARDYGDPGINTDETITDIIYCAADSMMYAVGDVVRIDSSIFEHTILLLKLDADSGSVTCDSLVGIGAKPATAQSSDATAEEPFFANTSFPIGNMISAAMVAETRCAVMVAVDEAAVPSGICQLVNPSGPMLQLRVEVPAGGASLAVMSLTGTQVWQGRLDEGLQQPRIALPQLSDGLYLIHVGGDTWRYPTLRWVIQR